MDWELWLVFILCFAPIISVDIWCFIDEHKLVRAAYMLATGFAFMEFFLYLAERA